VVRQSRSRASVVAQFETVPLPLGAILKSTRSLHGYRVQGFSSVADRNRPGNGDEIARSGDYIVQAQTGGSSGGPRRKSAEKLEELALPKHLKEIVQDSAPLG
jgi:hypothetical protein